MTSRWPEPISSLLMGQTMFEVRYSKPKMECLSSIGFVRCSKNDVRVSKSSESLIGLMFHVCKFEAKNRVFEFDDL